MAFVVADVRLHSGSYPVPFQFCLFSVLIVYLSVYTYVCLSVCQLSVSAGTVLLLWMVGSPVMSGVLQVLDHSLYARKKNLNTVLLLVATVSEWGGEGVEGEEEKEEEEEEEKEEKKE